MSAELPRIVSRPKFVVRYLDSQTCEYESHSHSSWTVTTLLSGKLQGLVGSSEIDLRPGQTVFTNFAEAHSGCAGAADFLSVDLNPVFLSELAAVAGVIYKGTECKFRCASAVDEVLEAIARALVQELSGDRLGRDAMIDALVQQLTIHLIRSHLVVRRSAGIELSRAGPVDRRLRRAIELIHNNYSRELDIEEMASAAYLSEYHFARLFKQIVGITPHVYLSHVRLDRARSLLTETALPITEIAALVGYQSHSHFTKVFRSITGLTPRGYRDASVSR